LRIANDQASFILRTRTAAALWLPGTTRVFDFEHDLVPKSLQLFGIML
jgi:hypothetical protein